MSEINLIIVPDPEEAEAAEVCVDGSVGNQPYRFLLDTGAAISSLKFDDYTAGFASTDQNHSSGVFARHSEDLITVPDLTVGPLSRPNFTLVRQDREAGNTRNLVGMDFLKDYRFHFLFNEQRVLVDPQPESGWHFEDLVMDNRAHPYLPMSWGETAAQAVWDTGAGVTVVDMNFVRKNPALFEETGGGTGTDSTGTQMETPLFKMSAPIIGKTAFPPLKVAGVELGGVNSRIEIPMDFILGYNVLAKADWYFDFPARKWAITRFY